MPESTNSVKLGEIIREFDLEILSKGPNYEDVPLHTVDVNRPGLPLAGFFEHFDTKRLLLIGLTETTYVAGMTPERRRESFDRLLAYPVPALIITRGLEAFPECLEMAEKYGRTVLRTQAHTSAFMSALIGSLYNSLAPCITRSGVMMEIYGEGVLFQGESGVGKSEVAIELIKRGHRLIADDAVEIKETNHGTLEATAPELIRRYMELRGIGVIDVSHLFGMGAIKMSDRLIAAIEQQDPQLPVSTPDYLSYQNDPSRGGWKGLNYLIDRGLASDFDEVMALYTRYHVTYEKSSFPSMQDTCRTIREAGGYAVQAHPRNYFALDDKLEENLAKTVCAGVQGVECYYPAHSPEYRRRCVDFCRQHQLFITCGGDCHGTFQEEIDGIFYRIGEASVEDQRLHLWK